MTIHDSDLEAQLRPELDSALRRMPIGDEQGCWKIAPSEIAVLRRMTGGHGGCEVLEAVVRWGARRAGKVVKVGSVDALRAEYDAYRTHLSNASALFAPIEAVSAGVLDGRHSRPGVREALVYDYASRFVGKPAVQPEALEDRVQQAMDSGRGMDASIASLDALFEGVRNDLYDLLHVLPGDESLEVVMNDRLGPAVEIEVDRFVRRSHRFEWRRPTEEQLTSAHRYPFHLFDASVNVDSAIQPGDVIGLVRLRAWWRGQRLFGRPAEDPRVEIELLDGEGHSVQSLDPAVENGGEFDVFGRVRTTRARARRERLLSGGTGLRFEDVVRGEGAAVPDPFPMLQRVFTERRANRVVSTAHGDLNPRNVLLVGDQPCLIDYARTRAHQPLHLDFATLECGLLRGPLSGLEWSELVRLQRLLGVTSRQGERCAEDVAGQLREPRLLAAYRLLQCIRRASRSVHPVRLRADWWREHLVQLYIAGHAALRYPDQTPAALRATVALTGVSAELLTERPQ